MDFFEYLFLAASSLFVIVDPIAIVPSFLAMTPNDTADARVRMARTASIAVAVTLAGFGAVGQSIFDILGITMPAFQVAGGALLFLVALDMLRARRTEVKETRAEQQAAVEKEDIAITPLAVPMLAGPGACTTVLLLQSQAAGPAQHVALYACIGLTGLATFVTLWLAARHAWRISPIALRVTQRLMGLLLAAIAVQFLLDGLSDHLRNTASPVTTAPASQEIAPNR